MVPRSSVDREFEYIVGRADGRTVGRSDGRTDVGAILPPSWHQDAPISRQSFPKPLQTLPKAAPRLPKACQTLPKASPKLPKASPNSSHSLPQACPSIPRAILVIFIQKNYEKCCKVCQNENWPVTTMGSQRFGVSKTQYVCNFFFDIALTMGSQRFFFRQNRFTNRSRARFSCARSQHRQNNLSKTM